jgi:hypothetical protein
MIAVVRAGVIFLHVQRTMPDAADGAPIQTAKMHDQIRRDVMHVTINFFGQIHLRAEMPRVLIDTKKAPQILAALEKLGIS